MTEKRFTMATERINNTYCCRILENDKVLFEVNNWNALSQSNNKEVEELVECLNTLHEENEELKQALLFYLDLAIQDSSYLNDGFEKGMELWCQRLFNCSYSEMKKEYSEYKWEDKWEMGE